MQDNAQSIAWIIGGKSEFRREIFQKPICLTTPRSIDTTSKKQKQNPSKCASLNATQSQWSHPTIVSQNHVARSQNHNTHLRIAHPINQHHSSHFHNSKSGKDKYKHKNKLTPRHLCSSSSTSLFHAFPFNPKLPSPHRQPFIYSFTHSPRQWAALPKQAHPHHTSTSRFTIPHLSISFLSLHTQKKP